MVLFMAFVKGSVYSGNATAALTGEEYFPDSLLKEAEQAWRGAARRKSWMSQMHHEVSQALWNLRIAHQNDCITADGLHGTSIIIDNSNVSYLDLSQSQSIAYYFCLLYTSSPFTLQ